MQSKHPPPTRPPPTHSQEEQRHSTGGDCDGPHSLLKVWFRLLSGGAVLCSIGPSETALPDIGGETKRKGKEGGVGRNGRWQKKGNEHL